MDEHARSSDPQERQWPRFLPVGDAAISVELGANADHATSSRVLYLHKQLTATPPPGIRETVPAFCSLLVHFDPLQTDLAALHTAIESILATPAEKPSSSARWLLPVCYAPEFAPDLDEIAACSGLTPQGVVECHASMTYYVYMLGFLPGFAYLGDLPEPLRLPRRADPRTSVPKGSVGIAAAFTAIYPQESPGGWHLIGRSSAALFDPGAGPPALLAPGDSVQFRPVSLAEFEALGRQPRGGAALWPAGDAVP